MAPFLIPIACPPNRRLLSKDFVSANTAPKSLCYFFDCCASFIFKAVSEALS
jgi:hypothetical protein